MESRRFGLVTNLTPFVGSHSVLPVVLVLPFVVPCPFSFHFSDALSNVCHFFVLGSLPHDGVS